MPSQATPTSNKVEKTAPDHERVKMIKYGITRETNYTYLFGKYRYNSLDHAVAQAQRAGDRSKS